jgi:plastocyanin
MNKISRSLIFSLAVLLALAVLAACGSAEETPASGGTVPGVSISITGSNCPSVEINRDDQIIWTNEDTVEHRIRIAYEDGEPMVDLSDLQPGDTASVTFPQAGSFTYTCSEDQASTGTITVQP